MVNWKALYEAPIEFASTHPYAACGMVVGAAMILTPGVVAGAMLVAGGFTLSGIAAGSLAAAVQSLLNPIVAHGAFATLQSAGAGGYGAAIVKAVIWSAGWVVGAISASWSWFNSGPNAHTSTD